MSLQVTATLTIKTCSCGAIYAVSDWCAYKAACPMCSGRNVEQQRRENERLVRANATLRGVISRYKRGRNG